MVLKDKGRQLALGASVLAAMALAAAVAGRGCSVDENSPEGTARAFAEAASAGDRQAIYDLLGPRTRENLEEAARRATDLAGSSQRFAALDMIRVARPEEGLAARTYRLIERSGDRAVVEIDGGRGPAGRLELVLIDDRWRIELPGYGSAL